MFRIGVIGTGVMGAAHARYAATAVPRATLAAVTDPDYTRAAYLAKELGTKALPDSRAMIGARDIDGVIIASPDNTHAELVLACLAANMPVLCEKPLAVSATEAKTIVDAEVESGKRSIALGFMRRFDPQHVGVMDVVRAGAIGSPYVFHGKHRNVALPSSPSTHLTVTGSAIHDIDSARWMLRREYTEVSARGAATDPRYPNVVDLLIITGVHERGALSTIEVHLSAGYGYEVNAELVGDGGVVTTQPMGGALVRSRGVRGTPVSDLWLDRFRTAYLAEITSWIETIVEGTPFPGANAWDGYASLVVAEAVLSSLAAGGPVAVDLTSRPEIYDEQIKPPGAAP